MLLEKELNRLFKELVAKDKALLSTGGADISIHMSDSGTKLSLITPVYFGGNYIPKSVRLAITKSPPFEKYQTIKTELSVEEESFRVFLSFVGTTDALNCQKFQMLVEEFCFLAEEWRIYLDEHDKDDLVYIYSRP